MRYGLLLAVLIGTSLTSRAGEAKPASPDQANFLKGFWYTHDEVRQCTFLFLVTESKIALEVLRFEATVPPRLASGYRLVEDGKHRYIVFLDEKSAKIEGIPPRIVYRIMGDRMELSFPEGRLQGTWTLKRRSPAPSDLPFERIRKGKKENSAGGNQDPFEIQLALAKGHSLTLTRISPEHALLATTTVITNSQYVLAVKEKAVPAPVLPDGLDRAKWQKVLWNLDRFPPGQESHTVLFVNCSEAEAFCRWLDKRIPAYRFRLPNPAEGIALETNRSELNSPRLENGYAPRPARGGGDQLLSRRRFWHAPLTMELLDYRELVKAGAKTFALPTREQRHEWIVGGSYHLPEAFPSSFRVIAVPVAKETGGRKGKRVSPVPSEALALQQLLETSDLERLRKMPPHWRLQMYNADQVKLILLLLDNLPSMKPLPLGNVGRERILSRAKREAESAEVIRQDLRTEGGRCAWALEQLLDCKLPILWQDDKGQNQVILQTHRKVVEHMRLPEVILKKSVPELDASQRVSLAESPLSNIHLLQELSYDREDKVRLAVANNIRTAAPTLARLRDSDLNTQVRETARQTISRLPSD